MAGLSGILTVDGRDAGAAYGVGIRDGAYAALACWPAMRGVSERDWPEHDGAEPDLLSPRLEPKDGFEMGMYAGQDSDLDGFLSLLKSRAVHEVRFAEAGVTTRLRLVKVSELRTAGGLSSFSVSFAADGKFTDEAEFVPDDVAEDATVIVPAMGLLLDGGDMSEYGVMPLDGIGAALAYAPEFKDAMKFGSEAMDGQRYDGGEVTGNGGGVTYVEPKLAARDATLPLLARHSGTKSFWTAWKGLLKAFAASGGRTLTWDGAEHRCYYKSMSVGTFARLCDGSTWCGFSLTVRLYEGR